MIIAYFTFSHFKLFSPASCWFWVHLDAWMWTSVLCIFVKSKTYFYAFMYDSSMVFLALFMNNLCISLFTNNLNRDPSLNLIIKDHALDSFLFHLYPTHCHLWNRARFNLFYFYFFSFVYALFLFLLSSLFLFWRA